MRLTGSYHAIGAFVSGIAALPRIVTLHDVEIRPDGNDAGSDQLLLDVTAKTYRYLDEEGDGSECNGRRVSVLLDALRMAMQLVVAARSLERLRRRATTSCALRRRDQGRPGGRIEPLPEIKPTRRSRTTPGARARRSCRTRRTARSTIRTPSRPGRKRPREFLEQFPLDTMRMVGTLPLGRNYGLVQARTASCIASPGNFIGQNDGRIVAHHGPEIQSSRSSPTVSADTSSVQPRWR